MINLLILLVISLPFKSKECDEDYTVFLLTRSCHFLTPHSGLSAIGWWLCLRKGHTRGETLGVAVGERVGTNLRAGLLLGGQPPSRCRDIADTLQSRSLITMVSRSLFGPSSSGATVS